VADIVRRQRSSWWAERKAGGSQSLLANEQEQQPQALPNTHHGKAAGYQPDHHRVVSPRDAFRFAHLYNKFIAPNAPEANVMKPMNTIR
jgi:hypothetical protein